MKTFPPGRDQRTDFGDLFSKSLKVRIICSAAFATLSSSAKSVCIVAYVKADNARFHRRKTADGRPVFTFSTVEAKRILNISNVTHTAALRQLIAHGFLEQIEAGGLLGANGRASLFTLSNHWRNWTPGEDATERRERNIRKALEGKRTRQVPQQSSNAALTVSTEELIPGRNVYFYAEGGRRARKGILISPYDGGWAIQGRRNADKFRAPVFAVPLDAILLRPKRRKDASL